MEKRTSSISRSRIAPAPLEDLVDVSRHAMKLLRPDQVDIAPGRGSTPRRAIAPRTAEKAEDHLGFVGAQPA